MINEELTEQDNQTSPQIKVAAGLWFLGVVIIAAVTLTWVVLAVLVGDYYSNTKAARDSAAAGSALISDLQNIEATKAWLMPLPILGVSTFLLGFGFAFANIMKNTWLQGSAVAAVFPALQERETRR